MKGIKQAKQEIQRQYNLLMGGTWQAGAPEEPGHACLVVRVPKRHSRYLLSEINLDNSIAIRAIVWSIIEMGWLDPKPVDRTNREKRRVRIVREWINHKFNPKQSYVSPLFRNDMQGGIDTEDVDELRELCMAVNDDLFTSGNDAIDVLDNAFRVLKELEQGEGQ